MSPAKRNPKADPAFEALLEYLRRTRGFDFTGYKRASLMRQVGKRMHHVKAAGFEEYTDYLEVHPEEFPALFNAILINVTAFFRDPPAWEYVEQEIIPRILANGRDHQPIRVWSAGCASGEEAYSICMLLAEALGSEGERFAHQVKIYATDIDEDALAQARQASYRAADLEAVPDRFREKCFEQTRDRFVFRSDLRRAVIFGRHDLVQDAPISRIDLLVCRNTLMYFNTEAQDRILARLHFAVRDHCFLFLGKAEMLVSRPSLFSPVDLRHRIFSKTPAAGFPNRLMTLAQGGDTGAPDQPGDHMRLREMAFDAADVAQIIVDGGGRLALANGQARAIFGLCAQDVGRPVQDLEISYRPVELRSLIEQAYAQRAPLEVTGVERRLPNGAVQYLDVLVKPLLDNGTQLLGATAAFLDVTRFRELQAEIEHSKEELETTNEELHSTNEELETTNEELQSTNEELETTNEELQSTVEELQTTNEELQSTNEEMETMNEELHCTNTQLESANAELQERTEEVARTAAFLESVLASVRVGVVVLDKDLRVLLWNKGTEDMWGLRAEEVQGKPLVKLDIGLPVAEMEEPARAFLAGEGSPTETEVMATNRRGRTIRCRISSSARRAEGGGLQGLVLVMEETADG
jgi:two-component system CheB/CheR fusion protein